MSGQDDNNAELGPTYYASLLQAWQTNKSELDKTLITLSVAGIGLLGALVAKTGTSSAPWFVGYILGFLAFLVAVVGGLAAFHYSALHIEAELKRFLRDAKPDKELRGRINRIDRATRIAFTVGIVISIILAFHASSKL